MGLVVVQVGLVVVQMGLVVVQMLIILGSERNRIFVWNTYCTIPLFFRTYFCMYNFCVHIYIYTHTYLHMHALYIHAYIHTYAHIYTYMHMHTYTYIHNTYIHTHTFICTYIHTYTHTHTHTHTYSRKMRWAMHVVQIDARYLQSLSWKIWKVGNTLQFFIISKRSSTTRQALICLG